jgi:hypothetical protein
LAGIDSNVTDSVTRSVEEIRLDRNPRRLRDLDGLPGYTHSHRDGASGR